MVFINIFHRFGGFMNCPACNKTATTWIRNSFSKQGVTLKQSQMGYLRCRHCNVLLRYSKNEKITWYILFPIVVVMALTFVFSERIILFLGLDTATYLWIALILALFIFVNTVFIKFNSLEEVKEE